MSRQVLNIPKEENSRNLLGSVFQWSVTLTQQKCSLFPSVQVESRVFWSVSTASFPVSSSSRTPKRRYKEWQTKDQIFLEVMSKGKTDNVRTLRILLGLKGSDWPSLGTSLSAQGLHTPSCCPKLHYTCFQHCFWSCFQSYLKHYLLLSWLTDWTSRPDSLPCITW